MGVKDLATKLGVGTAPDKNVITVEKDVKSSNSSDTASDNIEYVNDISVYDTKLGQYYQPRDNYEGKHRFDPNLKWTVEEEKLLVRKIDKRIMAWCCLMFFALQLHRSNLQGALSDGFLRDLNMNTNDYNYGQTLFFLSFLCAELPSQLISKWIGPDNWVPVEIIAWSIVAAAQSALVNRTGFFLTRIFLGLSMGGFIPDMILYLSYWYKGKELPIRLAFFWGAYQVTNIISAFLSFGILHMRGIQGWAGWRWIFALEGSFTIIIGIASHFYLPPSPTQTASKVRGKAWFSEREEFLLVTRVLRDDPGKGDMHNRQPLSPRKFWQAIKDYDMWPLYLLGLSWLIPTNPPGAYLTLTLRSLGFNPFQNNLLTIPAYVIFIGQLFFWTWLSEKRNEKTLISMAGQIWALPLLIALLTFKESSYVWARYAILTLLVGHPYCHAIIVAWNSRNSNSVRTRTFSAAFYNMTVQTSSIVASNIYRDDDKPFYYRGNWILVAITIYNIFLFIAVKAYYVYRNKQRDRVWDAWTTEQKEEYLRTTKDEGNKRLDFRFAH